MILHHLPSSTGYSKHTALKPPDSNPLSDWLLNATAEDGVAGAVKSSMQPGTLILFNASPNLRVCLQNPDHLVPKVRGVLPAGWDNCQAMRILASRYLNLPLNSWGGCLYNLVFFCNDKHCVTPYRHFLANQSGLFCKPEHLEKQKFIFDFFLLQFWAK